MCELTLARLSIRSALDMRALGAALAHALPSLDQPLFIALYGDLGTGKTTLVGGALEALGLATHARSPTYTLIEPYETPRVRVYHLDLYRLADASDLEMLGVRDLLTSEAVLFVEWPERGAGWLPPSSLDIRIDYRDETAREVTLQAHDPAGRALLATVMSKVSGVSS